MGRFLPVESLSADRLLPNLMRSFRRHTTPAHDEEHMATIQVIYRTLTGVEKSLADICVLGGELQKPERQLSKFLIDY